MLALLLPVIVFGQIIEENCISCIGNKVDTKKGASALGTQNHSLGINSFATGYMNEAIGDYSIAMPYLANATGHRSLAFGFNANAKGAGSIALGAHSSTGQDAILSISIGSLVTTDADNAIVIGFGLEESYLNNNIEESLMVGFNSDIPSFFVGPSQEVGVPGYVGIGTTMPTQLLEVNGNMKVNAYSTLNHLTVENALINNSLSLNSKDITGINSLKGNGELKLQSITGGGADITINTDGHVGIGTNDPNHLLEINGDFYVTSTSSFLGNVGIGTSAIPCEKLEVNGNIKTNGLQLLDGTAGEGKILQSDANGFANWVDQINIDDGDWIVSANGVFTENKVGIGAEPLDYKFEVTGSTNLLGNLYQYDEEIELGLWHTNAFGINYLDGNVGIGENSSSSARLLVSDISDVNNIIANFKDSENRRIIMVPKLSNEGYNPIAIEGDAGIFWCDNLDTPNGHQNLTAGFVIAPHKSSDYIARGIRINYDGQVGIGTNSHEDTFTKLTVAGKIHAQEVKVNVDAGADFVFNDNYKLTELPELENYVIKNNHLPDIPSAKEMQENGLELGDMQIKLLQKIEELTLYIIKQDKRIDALEWQLSKRK